MTEKRKVGGVVIMRPNHNNYGTSLQGFATMKTVQKLGYPLRIIRYNKTTSFSQLLSIPGYLRSGGLSAYLKRRSQRKMKRLHPDYAKAVDIRTDKCNQFKNKYFEPLCDYYTGFDNLVKGSKNYDVIFVGSDQVWGPLSLYAKFYNLLFVDPSVPKFSYASSFGKSFIMDWQKKGVTKFLNQLDAIGVREIRGKEIVEELTGRKATVVADPTLLLTQDEWNKELEERELKVKQPYILTYVLGPRMDVRKEIMELGKKTGLPVVSFNHMDYYEPADEGFGDIPVYDADCLDFINLIKHAEYVCTDSFHCSVFSIIFQRKFLTFYRMLATDKKSSNSRIDSLMSLFGLTDRIFHDDAYQQIVQDIDYREVDRKLELLRNDSMEFFKKCLEIRK